MAGAKSFPSLAPDVDPATADVPVGGYVCQEGAGRVPREAAGHRAQGAQHRRPPGAGRLALPFLRGQPRARVRPRRGVRAAPGHPGVHRRCASSRATSARSTWCPTAASARCTASTTWSTAPRRARPPTRGKPRRWRSPRSAGSARPPRRSRQALAALHTRGSRWQRFPATSTSACSAPRSATASGSATPASSSRSSATCAARPATRSSSAAARACATAWAWTTSSRARAARPTS